MTKQTFEEIVSKSYEHGDFEPPEVERVGDFDDPNGFTVIRRKIGDAVITEILSPDTKITDVNDGELIVDDTLDKRTLVVQEDANGVQGKVVDRGNGVTHELDPSESITLDFKDPNAQ